MNLIMRKANPEDALKIVEFNKATRIESDFLGNHRDDKLPNLETQKKFLAEFNDEKFLLVAFIEDELVGSLFFERKTKVKQKHRSSLGMVVKKDFWGRKIGSSLMKRVLELAQSMDDLEKIELGVYSDNERAVALYKKYGFVEEGRIKKAFFVNGEYHDELIMGLFLK